MCGINIALIFFQYIIYNACQKPLKEKFEKTMWWGGVIVQCLLFSRKGNKLLFKHYIIVEIQVRVQARSKRKLKNYMQMTQLYMIIQEV